MSLPIEPLKPLPSAASKTDRTILYPGLTRVINELNALGADIQTRITALEEKVASLVPCPDAPPEPETPPSPPDPLPPPPDAPDLFLLAEPASLAFTSTASVQPAPKSVLLYKSGIGTLGLPQVVSLVDPDAIVAIHAVTPFATDQWLLLITLDDKPAGNYSASITVHASGQTNADITIPITYAVAAAAGPSVATLNLSVATVAISVEEGSDAAPTNIQLTKSGTGTMGNPVAGTPSAAWISSVVITGASPSWNAQLIFDTDALADGPYTATVDFTASGASNNPQTLTVNLTVVPAPVTPPSSTYKGNNLPVGDQQITFNSGTRRFDNTVMITTGFAFGGTVHTATPATLQAKMDLAVAGDIIELTAGTRYTGMYTWPAGKTGYVKIRTAGRALLGRRVGPADISGMAIIDTPNTTNEPGLVMAPGARYLYLEGVCARDNPDGTVDNATGVISVRPHPSITITSESQLASRIIFHEVLCTGSETKNIRRTVRGDGNYIAYIDCYLGDTVDVNTDAQAVYIQCGGPHKFVNTYVSASGESILTGAGVPLAGSIRAHDFEFRRSMFTKPAAWVGVHVTKNLFEAKGITRALFEGCAFARCWASAQAGFFFVLTNYGANDEENLDITVYGVKVWDVGAGFNHGTTNSRAASAGRVVYDHVVMDRFNTGLYTGDGRQFQFLRSAGAAMYEKITMHHISTYAPAANQMIYLTGSPLPIGTELDMKNNIWSKGVYGIFMDGGLQNKAALDAGFIAHTFTKNAMIGAAGGVFDAGNADGIVATDIYTDPATHNYLVKAGSPQENWGDDGNDPGVDTVLVDELTSGCETGVWP